MYDFGSAFFEAQGCFINENGKLFLLAQTKHFLQQLVFDACEACFHQHDQSLNMAHLNSVAAFDDVFCPASRRIREEHLVIDKSIIRLKSPEIIPGVTELAQASEYQTSRTCNRPTDIACSFIRYPSFGSQSTSRPTSQFEETSWKRTSYVRQLIYCAMEDKS